MENQSKFRYLFILLIALIIAITALCLTACAETKYKVIYKTNVEKFMEGGHITGGAQYQDITKGGDAEEVTAIAYDGYEFVEWSDGNKSATRKDTNIQEDLCFEAVFVKLQYSVTYTAEVGGYISGDTLQSVEYKDDAQEVTAVPNDDYLFAGWSDGVLVETRHDLNIRENFEVSAYFVEKTKTLRYAGGYSGQVQMKYGSVKDVSFSTPVKDGYTFDGWYLDPELTIKITDGNGYYFYGNTIFFKDENLLYPKWISEKNQTFKILLVFIEEAHAQLMAPDKNIVNVDYNMRYLERKICSRIQSEFLSTMNNWFQGDVKFEIDAYFASLPIGTESYTGGYDSYVAQAINIPEVYPLLKDYRSIITAGSMNDSEHRLHKFSGLASKKYAYVYMDSLHFKNNQTIKYNNFTSLLGTFLHEFAHTVEEGYPAPTIHDVESQYWKEYGMYGRGIELIGLYLLNKTEIDGKKVGIPHKFWMGEINVTVNCVPKSIDGKGVGKIVLLEGGEYNPKYPYVVIYIPFGSDIVVEAIPDPGYRFVKWSDGIETSIRHDTNIISYLNITAIFERIT